MTRDGLIRIAQASGLPFRQLEDRYCDLVDLPKGSICRINDVSLDVIERFANDLLERAAVEIDSHCQDLCPGDRDMQNYRERSKSTRALYAGAVRALKINTGEEPTV